jgi:hypothetical protein
MLWLILFPAIHVYMGGVGIQQLFILIFSFFAITFHRRILEQRRQSVEGLSSALPLLYAVYAVLLLITVRGSIPSQAQAIMF